tara:strand:- start:385 stop:855 length:471 start_codon:yes stop_codon:yes gene_type:complete
MVSPAAIPGISVRTIASYLKTGRHAWDTPWQRGDIVSGTLKGFEIGFLKIVNAGEPVLLNECLMRRVIAVEVVLFLRVKPHADTECMLVFRTGLASNHEVFDIGNFSQRSGGRKKSGFCFGAVRVLQTKGDGVFNHGEFPVVVRFNLAVSLHCMLN